MAFTFFFRDQRVLDSIVQTRSTECPGAQHHSGMGRRLCQRRRGLLCGNVVI